MTAYVYVLRSLKTGRFYIGSSENVTRRLSEHNKSKVRSTKSGVPWELIHSEEFENKNLAYKREMQVKSYKGGEAFRKLIGGIA